MFDPDTYPCKIDTEVELTFLPFADISGAVRLVNKSAIVHVKPSRQDDGGRQKGATWANV